MKTRTIADLSLGLEKGQFSSVELTQNYLDKIKKHNDQLLAFITITEEQALSQATLRKSIERTTRRHLT